MKCTLVVENGYDERYYQLIYECLFLKSIMCNGLQREEVGEMVAKLIKATSHYWKYFEL